MLWEWYGHGFLIISRNSLSMLRCCNFKSCILWDLYPASTYFVMDLIMKAQAHFFTSKGQQTQPIIHYWHKSTSNNKASVKNSPHLSFHYTVFGHLPIFSPQKQKKKKKGGNFKHRFTYTYMLVKIFYNLLLYFLRVLDDSIHLFKCQQMENHLRRSSSSSWHGPSTLLTVYITLKKTSFTSSYFFYYYCLVLQFGFVTGEQKSPRKS